MLIATLNEGVVGHVTPTQFVHRIYQESHVRFRLVAQYEGDEHVANVVEFRFITGPGIGEFKTSCQVFGIGMSEYSKASDLFRTWVQEYVILGVLPQ